MVLVQKCHRNPRVGLTTNLNPRTESITTPLEVTLLYEPVPISKATLGGHHESQIPALFKTQPINIACSDDRGSDGWIIM